MSEEETSCKENFLVKTRYMETVCLAPVEYPDPNARGKGWGDICNATCGILCCVPKTAILTIYCPFFYFFTNVSDLNE